MLFPDSEAGLLKAWIVKRIEYTSDADADVLADYVLALLRHDGDADAVRELCEAEVPDFLNEDSTVFVRDVFDALAAKTFLPPDQRPVHPTYPTGPAAFVQRQQLQQVPSPTGNSFCGGGGDMRPPTAPSRFLHQHPHQTASRKRQHPDTNDSDGRPPRHIAGDGGQFSGQNGRLSKQARRGGGPGYANHHNTSIHRPSGSSDFGESVPTGPAANFRPNGGPNTMPSMLFQPPAAPFTFGPPHTMPGVAHVHVQGQAGRGRTQPMRRRQPCLDYETHGLCARGNACSYEHGKSIYLPMGAAAFFPPPVSSMPSMSGTPEYGAGNTLLPRGAFSGAPLMLSPTTPGIADGTSNANSGIPPHGSSLNRARGNGPRRRGGGRASFSAEGPNHGRTKSTLVIEGIPEDKINEVDVRGFFLQFGTIADITINSQRRLAVIKFDEWASANAAWRSPHAVFDNRFVKIYWFKEDEHAQLKSADAGAAKNGNGPSLEEGEIGSANGHSPSNGPVPDAQVDMEAFLRKQEEAQRSHEEKTQKMQEMDRQRQELENRERKLLVQQREIKARLQAKLAQKLGRGSGIGEDGKGQNNQPPSKPAAGSAQSEALRAQLAALEAEAKELGIDPNDSPLDASMPSSSWPARAGGYRGRGGFRARGYAPRGYRGRGAGGGFRGGRADAHAAYAAYSLDNRTRKVALTGVDFTVPERDETLRQYLFGVGEFTDIQTSASSTEITFKDRKTAEKFVNDLSLANKEIPGIDGQVETAWLGSGSEPFSATAVTTPTSFKTVTGNGNKDTADMGSGSTKLPNGLPSATTVAPAAAKRQQVETNQNVNQLPQQEQQRQQQHQQQQEQQRQQQHQRQPRQQQQQQRGQQGQQQKGQQHRPAHDDGMNDNHPRAGGNGGDGLGDAAESVGSDNDIDIMLGHQNSHHHHHHQQDQNDMDYDVADENQWDIK